MKMEKKSVLLYTSAIKPEAETSLLRREIVDKQFFQSYNQNHFQEVLIRNGVGGALLMSELVKGRDSGGGGGGGTRS